MKLPITKNNIHF